MILMSIRNLNRRKGVSNGTRLILDKASTILLHCTIATGANNFLCIYDPNPCNTVLLFCFSGDHAGEQIFIPRIELTTKDGDFPFQWKRRQFPVRPAFAMTINKSQGIHNITCNTYNTDINFDQFQVKHSRKLEFGCKNLFSLMDNYMLLCPELGIQKISIWQLTSLLIDKPEMLSMRKY